ncbi:MAG: hypothetical protein WDZ84_12320 [Rhodovibrionaceae bacterium]
MNTKNVLYGLVAGALLLGLAGCGYHTQSSSGRDYLQGYVPLDEAAADPGIQGLSQAVIDAASVEPLLTFPARIERGRLTAIPAEEAGHWRALAERLGPAWGEFVPVSPLIAAFTAEEVGLEMDARDCGYYRGCLGKTIQALRTGAARQHVDVVLIYEGVAWSESENNPLSLVNWTIIGLWLAPSKNIAAGSAAQALLLDVRNGYTYGTAQVELDEANWRVTTWANAEDSAAEMRREALAAAVEGLVPEVEGMLTELRGELAEKRIGEVQTE